MSNETTPQKETLQQVSDTALEKPIQITVDVQPQHLIQKWFQRWGLLPKKRVFEIRPLYLGTLMKLSKLILTLDLKLPEKSGDSVATATILEANYLAIRDHAYTMAEIVTLAIQNSRREADPRMIQFVLQNFTAQEMMGVLTVVLKQMDLKNFMSSIISVRGLSVLGSQTVAPVMAAS